MAKARPSVQKRRNEANRIEKRQAKEARKAAREAERAARGDKPEGVDADIAHIKPGPQAVEHEGYGAFAEILAAAEEDAADADRRR